MSDHEFVLSRLDELAEDLLPDKERALVEAHLEACPSCRAELASLHALLTEASSLPDTIEPRRDLWPGIAERLRSVPARPWFARPTLLLAAAALFVGATAAVTHLISSPPPEALVQADVAWEQELVQASEALDHAFGARRGDLSPETVAVLDANLSIIDKAIEDCRVAIVTDPSNPRLEGSLRDAWQRRLRVLELASRLPPNS